MPSFVLDENQIVQSVMSFDPVAPEQHYINRYDTTLLDKLYENGEFHDVEPLPNDSAVTTDDGGNVDE